MSLLPSTGPGPMNYCGPSVVKATSSRANLRIVRAGPTGLVVECEAGDLLGKPVNNEAALKNMRGTLWDLYAYEPEHKWRLQTRGLKSDWHDWRD